MKNMNWKITLTSLVVLVGVTAGAQLAKHFWDVIIDNDLTVSNNLTVGGVTPSGTQWGYLNNMDQDVATTSDVEHNLLQFPEIATPTTPATNKNRIYFKSDGNAYRLDDTGLEKKLGSGGGGSAGVDLLAELNGNCEDADPPIEWVNSGATFTAETGSPGFDSQSCAWDASAASQTLQTATVVIPEGLAGQNCAAEFWTKFSGTAGDVTVKVEDGTGTAIRAAEDVTSSSSWVKGSLSFICPASGSMRVEFESTADAAVLLVDNVKLGDNVLVEVSQATLYGTATWTGATNCSWGLSNNNNFTDFPVDADCPTPTVTGGVTAPPTKVPAVVLADAPPGNYLINAVGTFIDSASGVSCSWRFFDGTTGTAPGGQFSATVGAYMPVVTGEFEYSNSGSRTINMQASGVAAAAGCTVSAADATFSGLKISVYRYPLQSQQAYTADTVGWRVDANMGSTVQTQMGLAAVNPYAGIDSTGLDLVNNPGLGVTSAQIACAGVEEASGLTCSGSENVGISFNVPRAGASRVCVGFSRGITTTSFSAAEITFQLVETPNNAQTILQEGNERITQRLGSDSPSGETRYNSIRICGDFTFESAGKKTIRLFREQPAYSGISANYLITDRAATVGQRDMHWSVVPLNQSLPAPFIKNSVVSSSEGVTGIESVYLETSGANTVNQFGDWIVDPITDDGTGNWTVDIKPGTFSARPHCQITVEESNGNATLSFDDDDTMSILVRQTNTLTLLDLDVWITCHGPR